MDGEQDDFLRKEKFKQDFLNKMKEMTGREAKFATEEETETEFPLDTKENINEYVDTAMFLGSMTKKLSPDLPVIITERTRNCICQDIFSARKLNPKITHKELTAIVVSDLIAFGNGCRDILDVLKNMLAMNAYKRQNQSLAEAILADSLRGRKND